MDGSPVGEGGQGVSGLVFFLPVKRSQAGITLQLAQLLSRRRMNGWRRARSHINFRPESGTRGCVQWSLLQQHGVLRYLGPGVMIIIFRFPQANRILFRLVTAAARVSSWFFPIPYHGDTVL
jgi:hypothetical protein